MRCFTWSFLASLLYMLSLSSPLSALAQTSTQTEETLLNMLLNMNPNDPRLLPSSPAQAPAGGSAQSSFGFSMPGVTQNQMNQLDLMASVFSSAPSSPLPMDFSGFGSAVASTGPQTLMGRYAQQALQIQGPGLTNAYVLPGFAGWAGLPGVPALGAAPPDLTQTLTGIMRSQPLPSVDEVFGSLFGSSTAPAPAPTPAPSPQIWSAPQATSSPSPSTSSSPSSSSSTWSGLDSARRYGEALRSGMY